jgi:hypothetical protein
MELAPSKYQPEKPSPEANQFHLAFSSSSH